MTDYRAQQLVLVGQLRRRGISDESVLEALARVPRHLFVPEGAAEEAYTDQPLGIGHGQTISQPYIVAMMTSLLRLDRSSRVLEVGTGSGYQTAVLAELAEEVYSVEIVSELLQQARGRLQQLGYDRVHLRLGDGYYGWEENAPYDAIMATCAPREIPPPLRAQLADGGRMVLPVGSQASYQVLYLLRREGERLTTQRVFEVSFVPLVSARQQEPPAGSV